jgi:colanic acid/amylovoran biosynthesis glycosyltransferase
MATGSTVDGIAAGPESDSEPKVNGHMKLAIVSAKYPFGGKEPYLHVELRAMERFFKSIVVFPTSPETTTLGYTNLPAAVERRGLYAFRTFRDAFLALALRPRESLGAIAELFLGAYPRGVKLKNIAIVPSGLALGLRLRRGGFDHVHSYWLSTPASLAFLAARVAGVNWSSTAHLWDIYENNALATKLRSAGFIRAISARGKQDLLHTPGCSGARIFVVHVGVDIPPLPHVQRPPKPGAFALLCAANLVLKKGHRYLISALAILAAEGTQFHCTIAGDGELRAELETLVDSVGLTAAVSFRGHVRHTVLLDEIRAGTYDAMVLPSLELPGGLMEGIPVALMEAMSLGLPVISTATGSIGELLDDQSGRVIPQGDVAALAGSIRELASDPVLCSRLARRGYEKVRCDFNVREGARRLAELIRTQT